MSAREEIAAIDVPAYVEEYIDQYRAICQRDPDRGGDHRSRGKACDALRDAIRRAIYDAERPLVAEVAALRAERDEAVALLGEIHAAEGSTIAARLWDRVIAIVARRKAT